MAGRKSKYSITNEIYTDKKIWVTALYIRLSQEDEDNGKEKLESNSITSQKTLLNEFIEEHGNFKIYDTYIDDGYTGTDFNRPGFQKMLQEIKNNNINCVIVKDLSRLGRNYIEVGNYIEQIFPLFDIRFISINDNIDSYDNPNSTNTILVPFKNLINDEYARDTSIKIRTALNGRKKRGEFIGAFSPYGYIKDKNDRHKLIIDKEAATVVKKIFNWYVNEGIGKVKICQRLNDLGILNPTGHKVIELKQNYNNSKIKDNKYIWTTSTVRNILKNEMYLGHIIQGKRKTKSYKIHTIENVPQKDWIKVENTHEAIIDKETFEKAQNISKRDMKVSQKDHELSIWAGILKCVDCGHAMNKKKSTNKYGTSYEYYICSTYRSKSKHLCSKHTIKSEKLQRIVLQIINMHVSKINIDNLVNKLEKKDENSKTNIDYLIISKQHEIDRISNLKRTLYEDWKSEIITKEEYIDYKMNYENDIERLRKNIINLKEEIKKYENTNENEYINEFIKNKGFKELTRKIILELIDYIYIHENGDINIQFKFENINTPEKVHYSTAK